MFQRSGENAWETHCSWSMEVTVYIFCYLCVKCSLNEGHYLTIYCWFSPKGGKMDVPKVWVSRQENGIGINSKSFFFLFFFLLCAQDSSWELWMGFVGENKGKKKGGSKKGGNSETGISAWGILRGGHFPCFTTVSVMAKNCCKWCLW